MTDQLNYQYQTIEIGEMRIHIRSLQDIQEFQDEDNEARDLGINDSQWPLFGVLWPASIVLATIMETKNIKSLNILEVGCGLALSSLILKLRGADITATDYNPAAKVFLTENLRINKCEEISFIRADWEDSDIESSDRYNLIIGSDLLYQPNHSKTLSHFINKFADEECEVIIVDPNRGNQNKFTRKMQEYNFTYHKDTREFYDLKKYLFKGNVHHYHRKKRAS